MHDSDAAARLRCHSDLLDRLRRTWSDRASVRRADPASGLTYDQQLPDFVTELLPFHDHPDYLKAPREFQQLALSCGWLAYNEKTASIEARIVNPACLHLINGEVDGFDPLRFRGTIAQAMADESFHIVMVDNACRLTRRHRDLNDLQIPRTDLVTSMLRCQDSYPERWKRILVQLATAVVSETLITDYLSVMSTAQGIQPINRITTEIHRMDEAAHNGLFRTLSSVLYGGLGKKECEFFVQSLASPCVWFGSADLGVWRSMLEQIRFPNAKRMLDDCEAQRRHHQDKLNVTTLRSLLGDFDVELETVERIADVRQLKGKK